MTDIVSLLHGPDGVKAANEILRLRMNNARLCAALKPFSAALENYIDTKYPPYPWKHVDFLGVISLDDLRSARKAIKEGQDDE
jgi:hypothetical protein